MIWKNENNPKPLFFIRHTVFRPFASLFTFDNICVCIQIPLMVMRKNSRGRGHWQYAFAITTLIDNMFTYYKIYMCVSITKTCSRMTALTAMTGSNTERSKGRPMPFRLSTSTSRCFSRFHHHRKLLVNTIPIYPIHSYISPLVSMFVRPRSHSLRNQSGIRTSDIHTLLHGYMAAWCVFVVIVKRYRPLFSLALYFFARSSTFLLCR